MVNLEGLFQKFIFINRTNIIERSIVAFPGEKKVKSSEDLKKKPKNIIKKIINLDIVLIKF